jgi:hypothetical protein
MPMIVPILIGAAEVGAGYAALDVAAGLTITNLLAGAAMVGGVMSDVGALTGNQSLTKIGGTIGAVGAGGLGVESLLGGLTGASGAAAPITDLSTQAGAAETAADVSQTAAQAAGGDAAAANVAGNGAIDSTGAGATSANVAANGAINSTGPGIGGPAAENTAAQATGTGQLVGTPSGPVAPQQLGAPTVNATTLDKVPGTLPGAPGAPGAPGQGILSRVGDWYSNLDDKGKLDALKTGSGIMQGVMQYVAPSPLERAQAASLQANMDRLHWEQSLAAQHNAALASMKPGVPPAGQATWGPQNAPVNQAPAASAAGGYQPAQVGQVSPQLAAISQMASNPNAQPGILQSNMPQVA